MRHGNRATLVSFLMAMTAAPLGAQIRDTAAAGPRTASDTTRALPLPPLVVTASRVALRPDRLGFSLTVVDSAALRRTEPLYAADALRELAGTFVDEAAGPGGPTIVRLRGGEEVFTQILMDGVQLNENGGYFDFQGVTLGNIDQVEVMRGPQSAVHGSSAMSGVVQFLTKRGTPGPARVSFEGEGGTNAEGGSWRATADVSGGSEAVRYSAGLGGAYSRGIYALPNDIDSREASFRLDAAPSSRFDVSAVGRAMLVDASLPVRDPGATRVPLDPNARNERDRYIATMLARFQPSARWIHRLRASMYRQDFVYDDQRDGVADLADYTFFIFDADFRLDSDFRRSTIEYSGSHEAGGELATATLTWGALAEREDLDGRTSGEFGDDHQALDRNSVAGFAEVLVTPLAGVDLLVGARVERYEGLDAAFTPRASIVVDVVPGKFSLRAAGGRAYKAPNLQEQFLENPFIESNPDLAPETSTSIEGGFDWRLAEGRLAIGLTAFRQDFHDLIRAVTDEASGRQTNRNLGRSRARGVEWDVRWRAARHWLVGSDGAVVGTEVIDNEGLAPDDFPVGRSLPFRPDLVGRGYLRLLDAGAFSGAIDASYVGEQTVLTERFGGERVDLDPYVVVGLDASWSLTHRIDVYTRIYNLLGADYETAFDRHGTPFTAALGFRLKATS